MNNEHDDPFRDWLVQRIEFLNYLITGSGGSMNQHVSLSASETILARYDAEKADALQKPVKHVASKAEGC